MAPNSRSGSVSAPWRRRMGRWFPAPSAIFPSENGQSTRSKSFTWDLQPCNIELPTSNQELEALTSSVAHDLRAPLRYIQVFSTTLIEDLGPQTEPSVQTSLRKIVDTTRNMSNMVDDLLSLARLGRQELNPQVTGLNSLVQEVIQGLNQEVKGRQIDWQFGDLPFV